MKNFILIFAMVFVFTAPAHAGKYTINEAGTGLENENWNHGVIADAPYLIWLGGDWFIGAEVHKRLNGTSGSEGWEAFGKITYTGILFSLQKEN